MNDKYTVYHQCCIYVTTCLHNDSYPDFLVTQNESKSCSMYISPSNPEKKKGL